MATAVASGISATSTTPATLAELLKETATIGRLRGSPLEVHENPAHRIGRSDRCCQREHLFGHPRIDPDAIVLQTKHRRVDLAREDICINRVRDRIRFPIVPEKDLLRLCRLTVTTPQQLSQLEPHLFP